MGDSSTAIVVEDDDGLRQLYRLYLEDQYAVRAVGSGDAALDCATAVGPDIVLLDRDLPDMSGDEIARELRAAGVEAPISMVTGTPPDSTVAELPIQDYVRKPLDGDDFDALLGRLRAHREAPPAISALFAMLTRRARLESALDADELTDSDSFRKLNRRIEARQREVIRETTPRRLKELATACLPPVVDEDVVVSVRERATG